VTSATARHIPVFEKGREKREREKGRIISRRDSVLRAAMQRECTRIRARRCEQRGRTGFARITLEERTKTIARKI
jgi:hypothetical protein